MTERLHPRVRELVNELTESAPTAPPFPTPETVAMPPRRPRSRVLVAAAIAIALVAGAIGVVAATGGRDQPSKPIRSEERRGGKGGRCRRSPWHCKENRNRNRATV